MKIDNFRKSAYVVILAYDDLKNIGGWIQRPDMQILFKFQVNRMKIEHFRNTILVVELLVYVDLKNNWLV